jgi:hypothetical protein
MDPVSYREENLNSAESPASSQLAGQREGDRPSLVLSDVSGVDRSGLRRRRRKSRAKNKLFAKLLELERDHDRKHQVRSSRESRRARRIQLVLVFSCFVLSVMGAVFGGFVLGQKISPLAVSQTEVKTVEPVVPLPQSAALLDGGFDALSNGHPREAYLNFQKAQDLQPGLIGIDYLLATAAMKQGELLLAEQSVRRALAKKEMTDRAKILLDQINVVKANASIGSPKGPQFDDPFQIAEKDMKNYADSNLSDPWILAQLADLKLSQGAHQSASEFLRKASLRVDPETTPAVLSAKEELAKLQNAPLQAMPSLSETTSMTGLQAIAATLTALQHKQTADAIHFLERARDTYSPCEFQVLLNDPAFQDYLDLRTFIKR